MRGKSNAWEERKETTRDGQKKKRKQQVMGKRKKRKEQVMGAQGSAAAETQRRRGGVSRMRSVGAAQCTVRVRPEAQRRSFRPEAQGERPGSAPRRASASANPDQKAAAVAGGGGFPQPGGGASFRPAPSRPPHLTAYPARPGPARQAQPARPGLTCSFLRCPKITEPCMYHWAHELYWLLLPLLLQRRRWRRMQQQQRPQRCLCCDTALQ